MQKVSKLNILMPKIPFYVLYVKIIGHKMICRSAQCANNTFEAFLLDSDKIELKISLIVSMKKKERKQGTSQLHYLRRNFR